MNLFGAVANLGKAVVNTAMVPVDVAADCVKGMTGDDDNEGRTLRRLKAVKDRVEDAYEDTVDD